jgi:transcriptional regulator with XRE-family HTH domain
VISAAHTLDPVRPRPAPGPAGPAKPTERTRRAELATFLRARRERLAPEDLGLPPGPRRRTPGLRREEVAQLAGVGVTWYTWLEQGRPINASTHVLDAIARTLHLDRDEHDHLYRLAGVPSPLRAPGLYPDVAPEVRQVVDTLGHMALVINDRFDVLAWNRAFERWFPGLASSTEKYHNLLWATFSVPCWSCPMVNRREEMRWSVANLRGAYARHLGEPCWERFIADLLEISEDFAELWNTHDVASPGTRLRTFRHPTVGDLTFKVTSFGVHAMPGTRMVVYVPHGEVSERAARILDELDLPFEALERMPSLTEGR